VAMPIGADSPDATGSSASGGGSSAIGSGPGLEDGAFVSDEPGALAEGDAAAERVGAALSGALADEAVGSGPPHAARSTLVTTMRTLRRGSGIGPIVCRSGRVAPQP
jgi:hypothetical protein